MQRLKWCLWSVKCCPYGLSRGLYLQSMERCFELIRGTTSHSPVPPPLLCLPGTACHSAWGCTCSFFCRWSLRYLLYQAMGRTPYRFTSSVQNIHPDCPVSIQDISTNVVSNISLSFMLTLLPRAAGLAVEAIADFLLILTITLFFRAS